MGIITIRNKITIGGGLLFKAPPITYEAETIALLARAAVQPKQDLTPVVSDLRCPICGEVTVKEAICKGCREGAVGFTFRHICMEDDQHIFYVKAVEDVVEV